MEYEAIAPTYRYWRRLQAGASHRGQASEMSIELHRSRRLEPCRLPWETRRPFERHAKSVRKHVRVLVSTYDDTYIGTTTSDMARATAGIIL